MKRERESRNLCKMDCGVVRKARENDKLRGVGGAEVLSGEYSPVGKKKQEGGR